MITDVKQIIDCSMNVTDLLVKLQHKIIEQQRLIDDLESEIDSLKKHSSKEYIPKKTNRKLSDEEVGLIKTLMVRGVPDNEIVEQFPALQSGMLTAIRLGLTYRNVDPITINKGETNV